jgi:hypothetical protein
MQSRLQVVAGAFRNVNELLLIDFWQSNSSYDWFMVEVWFE